MTRRRLYWLGGGVLLLVAVAMYWLAPWRDPPEVAYEKIQEGMTLAEVEAIVGRAADRWDRVAIRTRISPDLFPSGQPVHEGVQVAGDGTLAVVFQVDAAGEERVVDYALGGIVLVRYWLPNSARMRALLGF